MRPPRRKATPGRARAQREVPAAITIWRAGRAAEGFGGGGIGAVARLGERVAGDGQEAGGTAGGDLVGGGSGRRADESDG